MGLAEFDMRNGWRISVAIRAAKLQPPPMVIWLLARSLGLPPMETQIVVLPASSAIGANVYLIPRQFKTLEGPVAGSLVLSTGLAALNTPVVLTRTAG